MPFGGQIPAVEEHPHLVRREWAHHIAVRIGRQRAGVTVSPGGHHEVVARMGVDLPLDPASHREAVLGAGDLIEAVEQDQAASRVELALPPAAVLYCPTA